MFTALKGRRSPVNPQKTKGVRELGSVDISSIREKVLNLPQSYWEQYNQVKPNQFVELKQAQHIVFKYTRNFQSHLESIEYPIWKEWSSELEPILRSATRSFGYEQGGYPRILLAKLPPQCQISLHIDQDEAANYPHKIHIPIQTNPDAYFLVWRKRYQFLEGHCYEVNNKALHGAVNNGNSDRIHLIFEYYDLGASELISKNFDE